MLVLLRNHNTGLYYSGKDTWTEDPYVACHFRFIDLATTFAVAQKLDAADVILDYQSPQCQLSVPVRPDWLPDSINLTVWVNKSAQQRAEAQENDFANFLEPV